MTETKEPYLFEHDWKLTTTNLNGWIWPKIKNIKNITTMTNINGWIYKKEHLLTKLKQFIGMDCYRNRYRQFHSDEKLPYLHLVTKREYLVSNKKMVLCLYIPYLFVMIEK